MIVLTTLIGNPLQTEAFQGKNEINVGISIAMFDFRSADQFSHEIKIFQRGDNTAQRSSLHKLCHGVVLKSIIFLGLKTQQLSSSLPEKKDPSISTPNKSTKSGTIWEFP